ncbi:MAG: hypothetical protein KAZ30_02310 [Candidatus Magasanikbacteria bacterium]|nr:hypothetical protein [Candidatus Magasanikbacteria bacterium]
MHILIVGDFPDKNKFIKELQRHRHYVALATTPDSALKMMDENEATFNLIAVPQGSSAKWMGTAISEGLKARLLKTTVIFVVNAEDDCLQIIDMQFDLKVRGIKALTLHPPLFFDFIADQLRPVGVELFNIQ